MSTSEPNADDQRAAPMTREEALAMRGARALGEIPLDSADDEIRRDEAD